MAARPACSSFAHAVRRRALMDWTACGDCDHRCIALGYLPAAPNAIVFRARVDQFVRLLRLSLDTLSRRPWNQSTADRELDHHCNQI